MLSPRMHCRSARTERSFEGNSRLKHRSVSSCSCSWRACELLLAARSSLSLSAAVVVRLSLPYGPQAHQARSRRL